MGDVRMLRAFSAVVAPCGRMASMVADIDQDDEQDRRRRAVLAAVRAIASGTVRSYGQVARLAGLPGRARWVARVLSENDDPDVPWHRVVRSDGRIAFARGSEGFERQRDRLLAEQVAVDAAGRVVIDRRTVVLDLDAEIWRLP